LIKLGTNLLYINGNHIEQTTIIEEIGLCEADGILMKKNLYKFKGYRGNTDQTKNFQLKGGRIH